MKILSSNSPKTKLLTKIFIVFLLLNFTFAPFYTLFNATKTVSAATEQSPDQATLQKAQLAIEAVGAKYEGNLDQFNLSIPQPECFYDPLGGCTIPPPTITTENLVSVVDFVTGGIVDLGSKWKDLFERSKEVDDSSQQAQILERLGISKEEQIERVRKISELSGDNPIGQQELLFQQAEQDLKQDRTLHPDNSLSQQDRESRQQYTEKLDDFINETRNLQAESAAWGVMTTVGGKITEAGVEYVAKPLISTAIKKSKPIWEDIGEAIGKFFSALFGKNAIEEGTQNLTKAGLREGKSVFVGMAQKTATSITGDMAENLAKTEIISSGYSPEIVDKALNLAQQIYPHGPTRQDVAYTSMLVSWGVPNEVLLKRANQVLQAAAKANYVKGRLPKDIQKIINIWRYEGGGDDRYLRTMTQSWIMEALRKHEENIQRILPVLDQARNTLAALRTYAIRHNVQQKDLPIVEEMVNPDFVHVVTKDTMRTTRNVSDDRAVGLYLAEGKDILILDSYQGHVTVCSHESLHKCFFTSLGDDAKALANRYELARKLGGKKAENSETYWDNYNKFIEGLNEWINQFGQQLTGRQSEYIAYQAEVDVFNLINQKLAQKLGSYEKANTVLIEAGMGGHYQKLFQIIGSNNADQGAQIIAKMLDPLFKSTTNVVYKKRVLTGNDLALIAIGGGGLTGLALTAISSPTNNQRFTPTSTPTPTPKKLPFRLVLPVLAQENSSAPPIMDSDRFEILARQQLIKNALLEDGEVDSDFVQDVMSAEIITSSINKTPTGYLLVTGKDGTVKGSLDEGTYNLSIQPITELDIKIPSTIHITKGTRFTIPILVKDGSGKIETADRLIKNAHQDKQDNPAEVELSVSTDDQSQTLPLAGVQIILTRINNQPSQENDNPNNENGVQDSNGDGVVNLPDFVFFLQKKLGQ